jgi:RNA polymerase sigma factor (sigma-70 family)
LEEKELIDKCLQGSVLGHKRLFEKYSRKMYYVALRYLSNKEDAEDAITEAFIKIFRNLKSFEYRGEGGLTNWIKTIVVRESLRILKKRKTIIYLNDINLNEEESDEFIKGYLNMEYILSLIQMMPDGYRIVFNMYVIENYCHKEIADLLGITVSTSKSQLFKARQLLMSQLKKQNIYETGRN